MLGRAIDDIRSIKKARSSTWGSLRLCPGRIRKTAEKLCFVTFLIYPMKAELQPLHVGEGFALHA